jgi:AraC-like DNA-binding protein
MKYRIQQAKLLLQQTDLSISHIGEQVGFNQAAYFTSCFVKATGLTPRTYRQRYSRSAVLE